MYSGRLRVCRDQPRRWGNPRRVTVYSGRHQLYFLPMLTAKEDRKLEEIGNSCLRAQVFKEATVGHSIFSCKTTWRGAVAVRRRRTEILFVQHIYIYAYLCCEAKKRVCLYWIGEFSACGSPLGICPCCAPFSSLPDHIFHRESIPVGASQRYRNVYWRCRESSCHGADPSAS
jgi:hypothetical protein